METPDLNATSLTSLDDMKGAFVSSLKRNAKQIREDRAVAIAEGTELLYKREVEDLQLQIRELRRERNSMIDLSPANTTSLVLASDFDSKQFILKDIEIGVKVRNLEIKLEIATNRYNELFT
jgi:formylmethanofuran dehydrogenase subunit E-like metal-binding protein